MLFIIKVGIFLFVHVAAFFFIFRHFSIEKLNDFIFSLLEFFLSQQRFLRFFSKLIALSMEIWRQEMMWNVWVVRVDKSFLIFKELEILLICYILSILIFKNVMKRGT